MSVLPLIPSVTSRNIVITVAANRNVGGRVTDNWGTQVFRTFSSGDNGGLPVGLDGVPNHQVTRSGNEDLHGVAPLDAISGGTLTFDAARATAALARILAFLPTGVGARGENWVLMFMAVNFRFVPKGTKYVDGLLLDYAMLGGYNSVQLRLCVASYLDAESLVFVDNRGRVSNTNPVPTTVYVSDVRPGLFLAVLRMPFVTRAEALTQVGFVFESEFNILLRFMAEKSATAEAVRVILDTLWPVVAAVVGGYFQSPFINPDGSTGYSRLSESGFSSDAQTRAVLRLVVRRMRPGMFEVSLPTIGFLLGRFLDDRASTALAKGYMTNYYVIEVPEKYAARPVSTMIEAFALGEVQRHRGVRLNRATMVAYEAPKSLEDWGVPVSKNGYKYVKTVLIKLPMTVEEVRSRFVATNFWGQIVSGAPIGVFQPTLGAMAMPPLVAWGNTIMNPLGGGSTRLVNPFQSMDLAFGIAQGGEGLTLHAGVNEWLRYVAGREFTILASERTEFMAVLDKLHSSV